MNRLYIYNEALEREQRIENPIVDIYFMDNDLLKEHEWLNKYDLPTDKFLNLINIIREINPMRIKDNPKYWDSGLTGGF